jgi:BirA family biotin operon repressor/biotin-[acetyl-CoA-carboxylase] ligase
LWLSAVVPTGPQREIWQALPLAAGLAVIESLKDFGVSASRLRWPNDVMVNDHKLAGLLVDKFNPQCAVVGMGVNVTNRPDIHDGSLKETATRLADLVPHPPALATLTEAILTKLRSVIEPFATAGLPALRSRINELWGPPRRVTIDLDGAQRIGLFTGVDDHGRLLLRDDALQVTALEPHQVRLLREIP